MMQEQTFFHSSVIWTSASRAAAQPAQSTGFLWFHELRFTFKVCHFKKQLQLTADVQISSLTAIGSTLPCVFSRQGVHVESLLTGH